MASPPRPKPTREALDRYVAGFNSSGVLKALAATASIPDPADRVFVRVDPIRPFHRGGLGTDAVNGGMLAAMFDLVIGITAALIDPTVRSSTVQLSMTFEQPVLGNSFTTEGWVDRAGSSTLFSSALIKDDKGLVCSRCTGLVRISDIPWSKDWQFGVK